MKTNPRSTQLRQKAALALAASRNADNTADCDNLRTKANGLEILATAEEWLDNTTAIPTRPRREP